MLTAGAALALALSCAPRVAPDVLLSVAYAESRWHTLAIHDNVSGEVFEPTGKQEAEQLASRLISEGHHPDLGLLQINAANLFRTGLTVATAFDPCASMRAGAQILLENYSGGSAPAAQQTAILQALSAYNTGSPVAGLRTYAQLVLASAQKVIPALRIAGIAPYRQPEVVVPSPSARSCKPGGWHYSADDTCRAETGWHVSAAPNAVVPPADTADSAKPIAKENP